MICQFCKDWYVSFARLRFSTVFLLFILFGWSSVFAQESTLDNTLGSWTDNTVWTDGTAPGTSGLNVDVSIYGTIQLVGNLSFNNGDLDVYDTLTVIGDLTVGNNSILTIHSGGVLIIRGDYTQNNQADISSGGTLVITGNFTMVGADNQGTFEITDGTVYILDPTPDIKTGSGYADLQCSDPADYPDNCSYGDEGDLASDPIFEFFESGSYFITASGSTTFCEGGSVTLSTDNSGTSYQWYLDGVAITGATSYTYTASLNGSYTVDLVVGGETFSPDAVDVTVLALSVAPTAAASDRTNVCAGDGSITLSYTGGTLGEGASAQWYTDAAFTANVGTGDNLVLSAPIAATTYYVRFEGTCNTTSAVSVIVSISTASTDPTGITITNDATCAGTSKTLTVTGGSLGTNADWNWSTDAAFGMSAGTGASITVDPATTTTYYVRAEGDCNTTASVNTAVTVSTASTDPTGITITNDATCAGTSKTLTVTGGSLGTNAIWNWSTDAAFGTSAGTGASITVDPAKQQPIMYVQRVTATPQLRLIPQ